MKTENGRRPKTRSAHPGPGLFREPSGLGTHHSLSFIRVSR